MPLFEASGVDDRIDDENRKGTAPRLVAQSLDGVSKLDWLSQ
jgi:hypothetical protein